MECWLTIWRVRVRVRVMWVTIWYLNMNYLSVCKTLVYFCRSNEYESAHLALLRTYHNTFSRYVIPCFLAPGRCTEPNTLSCR